MANDQTIEKWYINKNINHINKFSWSFGTMLVVSSHTVFLEGHKHNHCPEVFAYDTVIDI